MGCFVFHDWTNWSEIERGQIQATMFGGITGNRGNYLVQERKCMRCGKRQLDTQRTSI